MGGGGGGVGPDSELTLDTCHPRSRSCMHRKRVFTSSTLPDRISSPTTTMAAECRACWGVELVAASSGLGLDSWGALSPRPTRSSCPSGSILAGAYIPSGCSNALHAHLRISLSFCQGMTDNPYSCPTLGEHRQIKRRRHCLED